MTDRRNHARWLLQLTLPLASVLLLHPERAQAQRPYDGIQAGYDAHQLAEETRRANVAEQLYLNDELKLWAGLPTSRGETIYYYGAPGAYGYGAPGAYANLESAYAYGYSPYGGRLWARAPVFEPWPYVPGDIYGYRTRTTVRQPIGQHQEQTGPNRWESHPVYDPPLPNYRPLPPVDSPWLDRTPYATPRVLYGAAEGTPYVVPEGVPYSVPETVYPETVVPEAVVPDEVVPETAPAAEPEVIPPPPPKPASPAPAAPRGPREY